METLWAHPEGLFARDIADQLPSGPALTTVLTVLERLTRKGLVSRVKRGRAHHYTATASKEAFVAEAMRAALADADDVQATLAHFLTGVPADQVAALRAELLRLEAGEPT